MLPAGLTRFWAFGGRMGEDWRHILFSKGGVAVPNRMNFRTSSKGGGPGAFSLQKSRNGDTLGPVELNV